MNTFSSFRVSLILYYIICVHSASTLVITGDSDKVKNSSPSLVVGGGAGGSRHSKGP